MPGWLDQPGFPLMVSHRRLALRKRLPAAQVPWVLDSGGFSELNLYGEWRTTGHDYAAAVRRYRDEIGRLVWAAPRDWMCEPFVLAKTGLTVVEHQRRTTDDYLDLRMTAPDLPFIPVLQGFTVDDYHRHADAYSRAGIDLASLPLIGVGSVCRRQKTGEIERIFAALTPLKLHGFGLKTEGLRAGAQWMTSADSMAWSYRGRRVRPGCTPSHSSEANCRRFATEWRANVLQTSQHQQLAFTWKVPA